ncbi:hypothetical protein [Tychonema sp. LEGE 07203]|uniref:hypothetical protein n=1 Tax=Tychonema sp. LEGE 07203 TaxID=1828671 RepID=UPI001883043B|nr:hypothetical protein [Tychonema sp. LEGE 07203]MBE9096601.1 hypothetical protein [Tychonema sp. LEGE 07203]
MGINYKFSGLILGSGNFSIEPRSPCCYGSCQRSHFEPLEGSAFAPRAGVEQEFDPVLFPAFLLCEASPTPQSGSAARREDKLLGENQLEI